MDEFISSYSQMLETKIDYELAVWKEGLDKKQKSRFKGTIEVLEHENRQDY